MTKRITIPVLAALVVLVWQTPALSAPDAAAIVRKAAEAAKKAKTYQAKWRTVISMGDMGSMTMDMNVKATADGKTRVETTPVGTPTGMMAMGAAMASTTVVSDGKTMYLYLKGMNAYQKMPAPKDENPGMRNIVGVATMPNAKYKYVGTEMVRGRKCHAIKVDTPAPPQARGAKTDVTVYVDVETGRFRQVKTVMTMPGMGPGPNGATPPGPQGSNKPASPPKPMVITTTAALISETLNAPIPPETFKFTPPKDATEMKNGMMGPGMPGMGGPPGARPPAPPSGK